MNAKNDKIVCELYLAFIRRKPCVVCGNSLSEAHHIKARGWNSAKRNDFVSLPLCRTHHHEWHTKGHDQFESAHQINLWREVSYYLMEFFLDPDFVPGVISVGKEKYWLKLEMQ